MFNLGQTPFDLRLVAFRIPIRVHPSFWLGALLLGGNTRDLRFLFLWVMCAFLSILVHELGHALTAEAFGWPSNIVLYFGGGLAISDRYRNSTNLRSLVVSFMGPAAGFLFWGLLLVIEDQLDRYAILDHEYRRLVFGMLEYMNLYWGLLNLLPVLPLDGGHILQSLFQMTRLRDPIGLALKASVVVGGLAAYYFFVKSKQEFAGILMLMLCLQNVSTLQSRR